MGPTGQVGIAWYDDRHTPSGADAPLQNVYATWSDDGGNVYMAKLPMSDTTVEGATSSAGSALLWSLLGTGAGLAVAGVVLVVGLRRIGRTPAPQTVASQR